MFIPGMGFCAGGFCGAAVCALVPMAHMNKAPAIPVIFNNRISAPIRVDASLMLVVGPRSKWNLSTFEVGAAPGSSKFQLRNKRAKFFFPVNGAKKSLGRF
jgi:hypothetical protein